jgi:hypothetical protein
MQNILIGLAVLILIGALFAMIFGRSPRTRFTDADADGEPDETPEEKRRAMEEES